MLKRIPMMVKGGTQRVVRHCVAWIQVGIANTPYLRRLGTAQSLSAKTANTRLSVALSSSDQDGQFVSWEGSQGC